jgi:hypothetical protein
MADLLLFAPTTRFRDICEGRDISNGREFMEVELVGRAEDEVAHGRNPWESFMRLAQTHFVWIGHVMFVNGALGYSRDDLSHLTYARRLRNLRFVPLLALRLASSGDDDDTSDGTETVTVTFEAYFLSEKRPGEECDLFLQILSASDAPKLNIRGYFYRTLSDLAFSQLLRDKHNLKVLGLEHFHLDEGLCHALEVLDGSDLEVELIDCTASESAEQALVQSLRQNQGPTALVRCEIDTRMLADALRGNTSLGKLEMNSATKFGAEISSTDEEILVLCQQLVDNRGLVELSFDRQKVTDENVSALCQSLARHPTLQKLCLCSTAQDTSVTGPGLARARPLTISQKRKTDRAQSVLEMFRTNTVLHTFIVDKAEFDERILEDFIQPYLKLNLHRPRIRALAANADGALRAKLLGRALLSVNNNPTLLWMFLLGNVSTWAGSS